ncbi:MAG: heme ABC transporter ATP-binding protein [Chloroflexota bacterium]
MLTANNLGFTVGRKAILQDVSVELAAGELLAVVGPNGAGKSTLLKLLTGDIRPSSGEVMLEKRPLSQWSRADLAKRRAVLLQQSHLTFAFSVLEVVLMGRIPHNSGVESDNDYAIAEEALDFVGLTDFADRVYPTLSGGEQQRVQLARILAQIWEPPAAGHRYLLLDEPTASLDLAYQQQTLKIARRFAMEGTAVLAILHDLNLAAQFADRILMLKGGTITAVGTPAEVLTSQTIETVFDTPVHVLTHPETKRPLVAI